MRTTPLRSILALLLLGTVAACDMPDNLTSLATMATSATRDESASRALAAPSVVLVHGAFADATGWQDLIPILQRRGYAVVAVQNQLNSVDADIVTTRRVIDAQPGDVVLVGHSYGGVSISGAAYGSPKVKALVYVSAYAPDAGESVQSLNAMFPPTPLTAAIVPDGAGFAYIDPAKYADVFAQDVVPVKARVMAVTQKPANFATLGSPLGVTAAWHSIPSWYIVAQNDRTINPDLERFLAQRMGATTTELPTSHVPFVSRPELVAKVIFDAIAAVAR